MDGDREFRFSPRPNRAAEIRWRPWGAAAFLEARRLGRPILLSLSAVWCHWCHVMDETSYSDPRVIAAVNEHFVPVRVDNDRRPDVNRRYNLGGWPTTAFLAPSGDVLTGGTYIPPDQLLESLARVKAFFDANRPAILALSGERAHAGDDVAASTAFGVLTPARSDAGGAFGGDPDMPGDICAEIALQIVRSFDPAHGGLGAEPKFPQPDVFSFMLAYVSARGGGTPDHVPTGSSALLRPARLRETVRVTLTSIAGGGLYDDVEGGFFRYATRRDWTVPHYEKLLDDNARLALLLMDAAQVAPGLELGPAQLYLERAGGAIDYLLATLWRDSPPGFGGSQDADETYYLQNVKGRAALPAPFVDPTVYVSWNAAAARALLRGAPVLERPELAARALELLEHLFATARHGDAMAHYVLPDGAQGGGAPLLDDQAGVALAALDAYEASADRRWLRRAEALITWAVDHFGAIDGRLGDRLVAPEDNAGLLSDPVPVLEENAAAAEALLRLEAYTGDRRHRERARELLATWTAHYEAHGVAAAAYGRALLRYLERPDHVVVVGGRDDAASERLHRAALAAQDPLRTVQWLDPALPDDAARAAELGLGGEPDAPRNAPIAVVCRGTTCSRFEPDVRTHDDVE